MSHPPALPPLFKEELKDKEAEEGGEVSLLCELSKAAPVEWWKDQSILKPSGKYKMRQEGLKAELVIHEIAEEDAGAYICVCGEQQTTAVLTVQGKAIPHLLFPHWKPLSSALSCSIFHFILINRTSFKLKMFPPPPHLQAVEIGKCLSAFLCAILLPFPFLKQKLLSFLLSSLPSATPFLPCSPIVLWSFLACIYSLNLLILCHFYMKFSIPTTLIEGIRSIQNKGLLVIISSVIFILGFVHIISVLMPKGTFPLGH